MAVNIIINPLRRIVPLLFVLLCLLLASENAMAQVNGDYQTNAIGSWSWSDITKWQKRVAGAWTAATDYPGQNAGAGTVTILNNTNVTLNVSPVNAIGALAIVSTTSNTSLSFSGGNTLSATNAVAITPSTTTNNVNSTLSVGAGILNCGSITSSNSNDDRRDAILNISTGSINVSGNIAMDVNAGRNLITFSGAGTIDVAGNLTTGTITGSTGTVNVGGIFTPASLTSNTCTINYNGTGNQTIGAYNYYNLAISNDHSSNTITLASAGTIGIANVFSPTATFSSGSYVNTSSTINFNGTGSQTIPAFGYNNLTISGARTTNSITLANSETIGVSGVFTPSATFSSGGFISTGSTVDFNGDVAQNIPAFTYNNLLVSNKNSASATARTKTAVGIITVNGDLNIDGYASSVTTLALGNFNFTVNGVSNVNGYGAISDATANTNLFVGRATVTSNGRWNIAQPCTFRNGLTVDGTFAGSSTYTFDTNDQTIDGSTSITLTSIVVGTAGKTLTNLKTSGLTLSGTISGAGNFTNGDATNPAILYVTLAFPFTLTGTLNLASSPNTVNYSGAVAQTIGAYNFYNLTSSSTGGRILVNGGTVGVSGLFTPSNNLYTVTGNTVNFNGTAAQSIPAFTFNNLTVSGGSTKTLTGNAIVNTVLNLGGGILELAGFNLTIANTAANAIQGVGSSSNMISTNGTGYLQKSGNVAASFQIAYPVGSGGYYSPMSITSIGTVIPTYIRVVAVPAAINPSYIKKYWDVKANVTLNNATATFTYDPNELNGAMPSISYSPDGGTSWQNPPTVGTSAFVGNSFTITGTNPFAGWWTMGYRTFYTYQTGNWNVPSTWTSDPSGTMQVGSAVPGSNDRVVVLTGRTVTLTADVTDQNMDVTIEDGGFLNMTTFRFTKTLVALRGQGTLMLATANFPSVTTNSLVLAGGGTVEYNNAGDFTLPVSQTIYNHLTINTPVGTIATQLNNLALSGDLYVKQGVYRINDNTTARRELQVNGNLVVDKDGEIAVGTGNTNQAPGGTAPFNDYYDRYSHRVEVFGDFTNSGTVRFTNLDYPVYGARATNGFATVYFRGATNSTLTCDGQTDFYNLVLDKGVDQTYKLTVNPSAYGNFRLFGANYSSGDINAPATAQNPNINKALWIRTGTLVLSGFTVIPSLTEGTGVGTPNGDYFIPANGALVLDNPNVIVLVTADDYKEVNAAYGVSGGTGQVNGVLNNGTFQALSILGTLQVNSGYLSTRESTGIVTWTDASSQLILNGGVIDVKQFRSSGVGTGKSSYLQSGGDFILRGRFQRTPTAYSSPTDLAAFSLATLNTVRAISSTDVNRGTFNLDDPSNVFSMSGGNIRILDVVGSEAVDIYSSAGNINVTGGTVELTPKAGSVLGDAATWYISSNAPFYNFTVTRPSSTSVVQLNTGYPSLLVKNNFSLNTASFNANNLYVAVGGDFAISMSSTYTTGTNWTILNGSGAQTLSVNTATPLAFNKLKLDKPEGSILTLAGAQPTITVSDSLMIVRGTLNDGGKTIDFVPSAATAISYLYNSGVHTGTGKIRLSDNDPQVIDGDGTGVFQNLDINNTDALAAPVSLASSITVNGELTLSQDKLLDIQTYNLKLNSTASIANTGANRYIKTSGKLGDGGITRVYSGSSTSFTFPVGTSSTSHAASAYTPATLAISGTPTAYGSITVNPVGYEHPATTSNGRALTYFWRVKSAAFTLGSATVTHSYKYDQADVVEVGADPKEDGYVAARYLPGFTSWSRGGVNDVDDAAANTIGGVFLTSKTFIDGDYTAGDDAATNPFGTPTIYYSRINGAAAGSGLWSSASTWSTVSHTGPAAAAVPGINDIVIVGAKDSVYLATDNTIANTGSRSCASLQIEKGSALDIGYNPTSSFGMVLNHPNGNGNFRLTTSYTSGSTFAFPSGDFTDFNVNLGTTELYSTNPISGTTYWLPNGISSYGNLIISPKGGSNIIFPNNNVTILGNCTIKGQNADSWFCPTWGGNYPTAPVARVAKTITIKGNLDIRGGSLGWYGNNGGGAQNIVVNGDVLVAPLAGIDVWSSNTSQRLSIGGSLINNTTNTKPALVTTNSLCNFTNVDVVFFGDKSASISNTGLTPATGSTPVTIFGKLTVNKGNSQDSTLTINIGGALTTPADNWLTLKNGTLRYMRTNPSTDFTISQGKFTIPSTAGLYVDYTTAAARNVLIANSANDNSDLVLDGKLTLVRGNVYVGRTTGTDVTNNDIEYSGGGSSAIDVQGGVLKVNGQIRRNTSSTVGVLKYAQSGGDVIVNGNNSNNLRAKFEVLNAGSSFSMTNGTLTIVRGGGTTFGDLYLRPATGSITGGDIIFTQIPVGGAVADAVQSYQLESSMPLNNLTITGKTAAAARNATVNLMVSPLLVNGNLTLSNANSILITNNRDVTITKNFSNSGTYTYGTNTTTFNGGVQAITGSTATNFNNLVVSSETSLSISSNFTVDHDLSILSGDLTLGTKKLTLKGDMINNGSYSDNNSLNSGVVLQGATKQFISGSGTFGRLELNNQLGARSNNDIILSHDLLLTKGILDINQYMLTLSQTSAIGGAPFDIAKMIITDGATSSKGVRKYFSASPATPFIFPIGVSGKYTPATYDITASNTVGYITVRTINSNHPAVLDPTNVLKYYWNVETSGITGFSGTLSLQYVAGDVRGVEGDYVAANLMLPGTFWSKATTGSSTDNVNETTHTITFRSNSSNDLTGDYTAGADPALPDDIPIYRSVKDGDWTNITTWEPVGASPPCPSGGPNGFNVIVDHEVTADANYCFAYQTTINGKLKIVAPFFGHNLGDVEGTGTLYLESGNLPAGNFDTFLSCSNNGTLEYNGAGTYTIIASQYSVVPNLLFKGSGSRILPNKDLTICNRLVIDGPMLDNSVNKRKLTILGTMERYNTGGFNPGTGANATVSFAGSNPQVFGGSLGSFNLPSANFCNFEVNNPNGLTINSGGAAYVYGNLLLTDGLINTSATGQLWIINSSIAAAIPANGSATSYVNGPLIKRIASGSSFGFPIGKGMLKSDPIMVEQTAGAATAYWTVELLTPNPTPNAITAPLEAVNTEQTWSVKSYTAGTSAKVRIGWDTESDLTPLMTINGVPDMKVTTFNGGTNKWETIASTAAGTTLAGTVVTDDVVAIGTSTLRFTSGSITTTKARASLAPTGPICGAAGIPVKFTSYTPIALNYTLTYAIDGAVQPVVTVTSLPYVLPTPVQGSYELLSFKFNGGASSGVVSTSTVDAYSTPTTSNAGIDVSQCSSTSIILNANPAAPYAGLWSVISGAGGNVITPTSNTSDFIGIAGNTYTLRWTISNGTCKSIDDVVIAFPLTAQKPSNFITFKKNVCRNSTNITYSVDNVPATTFSWTYSGTDYVINGTGSSVTLNYGASSTSGTLSVTATNSCGATSTPRTLAITVLPVPSIGFDAASVFKGCAEGGTTVLLLDNTTYPSYSWSIEDNVGNLAPANSFQTTITWLPNITVFPSGGTQVNKNVSVVVTDANGCKNTVAAPVTIYRRPFTGPPYHVGNNVAK